MTEYVEPFGDRAEVLEFNEDGRGIKVGPDPTPIPRESLTLIVLFDCSDGETRLTEITFPQGIYVKSMTLDSQVGTKKLGPLLRTNFSIHEDSKQLHTICRRESDIIDELEY